MAPACLVRCWTVATVRPPLHEAVPWVAPPAGPHRLSCCSTYVAHLTSRDPSGRSILLFVCGCFLSMFMSGCFLSMFMMRSMHSPMSPLRGLLHPQRCASFAPRRIAMTSNVTPPDVKAPCHWRYIWRRRRHRLLWSVGGDAYVQLISVVSWVGLVHGASRREHFLRRPPALVSYPIDGPRPNHILRHAWVGLLCARGESQPYAK